MGPIEILIEILIGIHVEPTVLLSYRTRLSEAFMTVLEIR
jgi:hypothetical protein